MLKTIRFSVLFMALLATSIACTKDDEETEENTNNSCANGASFCMNYDGTTKSGTAKLVVISSTRFRVLWENSSGGSFEQVELDLYGAAAGTYTVDTTRVAGTAAFQYFSANPNVLDNGIAGSVNVTSFDPTAGASGTFTVTTENGVEVTNGIFSNAQPQ